MRSRIVTAALLVAVLLSGCTVGQFRYLEALNGEAPRPAAEVEAYVAAATAAGVTDAAAEEVLDTKFEEVFGQPRHLTNGAPPGTEPELAAPVAATSTPTVGADPIPWVTWDPYVEQVVLDAWMEFAPPMSFPRAVALIGCESGGNPNAVNSLPDGTVSSRATGLAQWIGSTWTARAPQLGYTGALEERFDPVANARVLMWTLAVYGDGDWRPYSGSCWLSTP